MDGDFIRYRGLIVIAVGAGVMVGAAGVFLYQQLFGDRRRALLEQDIEDLNLSVAEIRRELTALRTNQQIRRRKPLSSLVAPSITTEAETDMFSATGGDELEDEFFELAPENEISQEENKDIMSFEAIDLLIGGIPLEDKIKAYGLLLEMLEQNGDDEEVFWRLARTCYALGIQYESIGNRDKSKEMIFKGAEYGQKAIEMNNLSSNAHKWFAVCVGRRAQMQNMKDKLKDGHIFKDHVDKALDINPQDATLHHLRGRFNFEVAKLSWIEQKVASSLFGAVPEVSMEAAIKSLLEAERLSENGWKENRLLLARCYLEISNFEEALDWLNKAKELPVLSSEDAEVDKDVDRLLQKHRSRFS
uniref:Regulator of microtubule dynamics protein 2 n=1 Tax=Cuerna arida TaxID=1464854 RepID=A0A1B6GZ04_9HEMI